jgi:hypothetical protein
MWRFGDLHSWSRWPFFEKQKESYSEFQIVVEMHTLKHEK